MRRVIACILCREGSQDQCSRLRGSRFPVCFWSHFKAKSLCQMLNSDPGVVNMAALLLSVKGSSYRSSSQTRAGKVPPRAFRILLCQLSLKKKAELSQHHDNFGKLKVFQLVSHPQKIQSPLRSLQATPPKLVAAVNKPSPSPLRTLISPHGRRAREPPSVLGLLLSPVAFS